MIDQSWGYFLKYPYDCMYKYPRFSGLFVQNQFFVGETTSLLRAISKIARNHREIFCALGPKKLYILIAVFHLNLR